MPATGRISASLAKQDVDHFLMQHYNWELSHQFNAGLAPAVAEVKLNAGFRISWPYR